LDLVKARYSSAIAKIAQFMWLVSNSDAETSKSKLTPLFLQDLYSCTIYLYAANDPVIEASENLKFGPFNISYPLLAEHAQKA
jgi:hypothetical protein